MARTLGGRAGGYTHGYPHGYSHGDTHGYTHGCTQSSSRTSQSSPRGPQCLQSSLETFLGLPFPGQGLSSTMPVHKNKPLGTLPQLPAAARGCPPCPRKRCRELQLGDI